MRLLGSDASISGVQILTGSKNSDFVSESCDSRESETDSENEHESIIKVPVSHSAAACMFKCLTWLEYQPEASAYNTSVLR